MEEKINVAAILKDKPQGTKLYDLLYNIDVELDTISTTDTETVVWCTKETDNNTTCHRGYSEFGTVRGGLNGLQILLPSKEMRDWNKFAWKKGDVLISNDGKKEVFFNGFTDDTYALFKAKHGFEVLSDGNTMYLADEDGIATSDYTLEDKDVTQTYINTIEERLGGKLNRETLKVEKPQPEFKDWDFITIKLSKGGSLIGVFKAEEDKKYYLHASFDSRGIITICEGGYCIKSTCIARLSTEEEKMRFFDALAKKGKTWDSVKKAIVGLKPKVEFKPFDKVLCRNSKDDTWEADFFARLTRKEIDYTQSGKYLCVEDLWMYCIPYNEETAHLLGTTEEWKGGEA